MNELTDIDFDIGSPARKNIAGDLVICQQIGDQPINGFPAPTSTPNAAFFESADGKLTNAEIFPGPGGQWYLKTDSTVLKAGEYFISYHYTNSAGAPNTITKKLIVYKAPVAVIDMGALCVETDAVFTHGSTSFPEGEPFTYHWNFDDDGQVSTTVDSSIPVTHRYDADEAGIKNVLFRITTSTGCSHEVTEPILVGLPPEVRFNYTRICSEIEATEFTDETPVDPTKYNIVSYEWDFDDPAYGPILGNNGATIPDPTHDGNTTGTYNDPNHRYVTPGIYNVTLSVATAEGCVASKTNQVYILGYGIPTPTSAYMQNFETGANGWVALPLENIGVDDGSPTSDVSWIFGTPGGDLINTAQSGSNAWWTGANAGNASIDQSFYYRNEDSQVLGPCLNLTDMKRPMISLNYWSDTNMGGDGTIVQYSVNGGRNWTTIGDAEDQGINWYNSRNLQSSPDGKNNYGWTGGTGEWKSARFDLNSIPETERDLVVFRIVFSSTERAGGDKILEGFAFDDVYIGEKTRNVLVELFTNAIDTGVVARKYFNDIYNVQAVDSADFMVMQYHMANPAFDQLNAENPVDPLSRAQWYGVATPSTALMDGIQGKYYSATFNGMYKQLTPTQLNRRSLEDPLFDIQASLDDTTTPELTGNITFNFLGTEPYAGDIMLHAVLVESDLGNENVNVVRKMIWGPQGIVVQGGITAGYSTTEPLNFNMNAVVADPQNLYMIVFVQDHTTKRILQSVIVKSPEKAGVIVGLPEDPSVGKLKTLKVYPNPASSIVKIANDEVLPHSYQWEIVDQRGVSVSSGVLKRDLRDPQEIDVRGIANGIYFLVIQTGDRSVYYKKIAVMNRD